MSKKRLLLLFLLLAPLLSSADSEPDNDMSLSVKPVLCITDARSKTCDIAFLVEWRSELNGDYCLFNDLESTALRCWSNRYDGQHNDKRLIAESFTYWMTGEEAKVKLVVAAVEVLRLDSNDRRRKRRSRHVWDIN